MASSTQATPSPPLKTLNNFCTEWFVVDVKCSCVTAEHCSSSNLIAVDPGVRSRGLRVEHYIRPPVTVCLELRFPIAVWCVLLCLELPQDAVGRVELLGSAGREREEYRLCAGPLVATSGTAVLAARTKKLQGIVSMASKLSEWKVQNSYAGRDLSRLNCVECCLRDMPAVRQLRCLQVHVSRWSGPKPVTIKWLEVWGVLSTTCSKDERKNFLHKLHSSSIGCPMTSSVPPQMFKDTELARHEDVSSILAQNLSSKRNIVEGSTGTNKAVSIGKTGSAGRNEESRHANVPDELLDALTFELMVLPMLLPSGHYVDRSTLDKLAAADALYGRPPTDPFTGVAFSASCQPEFSVQLKSQLDQYLSSRATGPMQKETLASGRTLGSSSQIQLHRTRQRKSPLSSAGWLSPDTAPIRSVSELNPDTSEAPESKRARLHGIESAHPAVLSSGSSTDLGDHRPPVGQEEGQGTPEMSSHETEFDLHVNSSLEVALNQVLRDKQL